MDSAKHVIEAALDEGADADEVLVALTNEGWHFLHGPEFQRWRDSSMSHEVFAYIGTVDNLSIVCKEQVSERSLAHMAAAGIENIKAHLRTKYAMTLMDVLTKERHGGQQ